MECWRETEMNHIGKIASARWQQGGGGRGGLWGRQEERLWEAGQNVFLSVVPSPTEAKNEVKQRAIDDDGDGWETTNSASHAARLAVSVSKDEFFSLSLFVFGGGSCDFFLSFFFSLQGTEWIQLLVGRRTHSRHGHWLSHAAHLERSAGRRHHGPDSGSHHRLEKNSKIPL